MSRISRREIILISAIGLISLALISTALSQFKTNSSSAQPETRAQDETRYLNSAGALNTNNHYSGVQSADDLNDAPPQSIEQGKSAEPGPCNQPCQDNILKLLEDKGRLSSSAVVIITDNPEIFAARLKKNPALLSALLATLQEDEDTDNGTQLAADAVLSALSDIDKSEAGTKLVNSTEAAERVIGLKLLEPALVNQSAANQRGAARELNRVLVQESDPHVLSKAINVAARLQNEAELSGTLDALTDIIRFNQNDHFSGSALMAKVNISPASDIVQGDILSALQSSSAAKNSFGLTAFEAGAERHYAEFEETGLWQGNQDFRAALTAITQNEASKEHIRVDAQRLLHLYYKPGR